MANASLAPIVRFIRRLASSEAARDATDSQLVQRFHAERDEEAFAALLVRHGLLVWSVCRRVLNNAQDAEDVFQATFLVLARKAGSIRRRESLPSWLYGVAYRTAVKTRSHAGQRRLHEGQAAMMSGVDNSHPDLWRELQPVLDEELNQLPKIHRDAIVLHFLEGKTQEEAAHQLGCQVGTIKSRLSRGLEKLRERLARRGIGVSAAVLGAVLAEKASALAVAVPAGLAGTTVKAALLFAAGKAVAVSGVSVQVAVLAQGVVKTMLISKLMKISLVVVVVAATVGTVGGIGVARRGEEPLSPVAMADELPAVKPETSPQRLELKPNDQEENKDGVAKPSRFPMDVAYSSDGRWLVSCDGGQVRVLEPATGKEIRSFKAMDGSIHAMALAADSKVAVAGNDGKIHIWDVATGNHVRSFQGHGHWTRALWCSADGSVLAGVGEDDDARKELFILRVWNTGTGEELPAFVGGRKNVGMGNVAVSPDGKLLAWGDFRGGGAHVVNVADGTERYPLTLNHLTVPLAFSPDNKLLAHAAPMGGLVLVDAATGKEARKCPRKEPSGWGESSEIAFTGDGKHVLALGSDFSLGVWDVRTGTETRRIFPNPKFLRFAVSADGKTIAGVKEWRNGVDQPIGLLDVARSELRH